MELLPSIVGDKFRFGNGGGIFDVLLVGNGGEDVFGGSGGEGGGENAVFGGNGGDGGLLPVLVLLSLPS